MTGKDVRILFKTKGLKQQDIAEIIGISRNYLITLFDKKNIS